MKRKKEIHNPYNLVFNLLDITFPEELHILLKIPGTFLRVSSVTTLTDEYKNKEADASHVVDPDFDEIFERVVQIIEDQSTPVSDDKSFTISDYVIQKIRDENLPPYVVIATNTDPEKSVQKIKRTPSFNIEFKFLDLGEEDNKERLINLTNKINNNEKLETTDMLQICVIARYVKKEYAKERLKQLVKLYQKIVGDMPPRVNYVVYSSLYAMIDAHFDSQKEFRRLIAMINQSTSKEIIKEINPITVVENRLSLTEKRLDRSNTENAKLKKEQHYANNKINKLEKELESVNTENIKLKEIIRELKNEIVE